MKNVQIPLPELGLIAATRSLLGAGIGLLFVHRLKKQRRRVIGRTLLAVGALSTIPLVVDVLARVHKAHRARPSRFQVRN